MHRRTDYFIHTLVSTFAPALKDVKKFFMIQSLIYVCRILSCFLCQKLGEKSILMYIVTQKNKRNTEERALATQQHCYVTVYRAVPS